MIILGVNAFHADSSAALVRRKLIAAAEEERFRPVKHWAGLPSQAVAYCLSEAGVQLSDVEHHRTNQLWWVELRKRVDESIARLIAKAVMSTMKLVI